MITNRGIKVWPEGFEETFCTDHWRCRFKPTNSGTLSKADIIELLSKASQFDIDVIKTENLYFFDGVQGFSLGQGQ
jgi:isocitrate dehydrogenase